MARKYKVASISHAPDGLIDDAKERAANMRMSFSAYVCTLIERDLKQPARSPLDNPQEKRSKSAPVLRMPDKTRGALKKHRNGQKVKTRSR